MNFTGSMACELTAQGKDYTYREHHVWQITGPAVAGMQDVFPALWLADGSGSASRQDQNVRWNASWQVLASQRVRLFLRLGGAGNSEWQFGHASAQAAQPGGVTGVQTKKVAGQAPKSSPISASAGEAVLGSTQHQPRDATDVVAGMHVSDQPGPNPGLGAPKGVSYSGTWKWRFVPVQGPVVKDQAFAPGSDTFDVLERAALELRRPDGVTTPTTNILSTSGSLENFMQVLRMSPVQAPRPVREIIVVSHASETGWLDVPLIDNQPAGKDQFEILSTAGTALNVPDEVLTDAGGTVRPAIVRIRGCRIGIAEPFLRKLKGSLKNVHTIVAPKHYQAAGTWGTGGAVSGRLEFLLYCFESYPNRPVDPNSTAKTARQAIITAFKSDAHLRVDGTPVPAAQWSKWLKTAGVSLQANLADKYSRNPMPVRLPANWHVNPASGGLSGVLSFKHEIATNNGPWNIGGADKAGGTAAQRRAFVKQQLAGLPLGQASHEWPVWQRYLKVRDETFTSLDDFVAGFDWSFQGGSWFGLRHVYRLLVPITLPADSDVLLANYYPVGAEPAFIGLAERNGAYFTAL